MAGIGAVAIAVASAVRCAAAAVRRRCGVAEIKVSAANGCSREWPKPAQEQEIGRNWLVLQG